MKPARNRPAGLAPRTAKNTVALLAIALVFTGCFQHYFRTNTQTTADPAILDSFQKSKKYFIVHFSDNNIFGLNNVTISNDKIEGNLVILPDDHNKYLNPAADSANKVQKRHKATALLEVHLYTVNLLSDINRLSLPLSSLNRVDVYTFDAKKTKTNHILSAIGIGATVAVIAGVISLSAVPSF